MGVVLGQRRLAIIDLSPGGAQPMHSADGRYVITFNGEIYNYRAIREELAAAGRPMHSDSDTEVLLDSCALLGIENAIERAIGMFAFALWDRTTRTLSLVRDRLGIKPLYYAATPEHILFASQLKALCAAPDWRRSIDEDAMVAFCGTATLRSRTPSIAKRPTSARAHSHSAPRAAARAQMLLGHSLSRSQDDAVMILRPMGPSSRKTRYTASRFREAASDRRCALGTFLSGGNWFPPPWLHSMYRRQKHAPGEDVPPSGFTPPGYDEARFTAGMASHLHTDHTEFYVEPKHALDLVPRLADSFDEPFRTVRRFQPFSSRIDSQTCDGGALRRRRRRAVCGLQPLSRGEAGPARH